MSKKLKTQDVIDNGQTSVEAAEKASSTPASKCPITRDQFRKGAKALMVRIGDSTTTMALPKLFSTGSFGWFAGEKIVVEIDGVPCRVQMGLNLTVVGSKDSPR